MDIIIIFCILVEPVARIEEYRSNERSQTNPTLLHSDNLGLHSKMPQAYVVQ